jgi:tetraacyldisaccharide 4'-kinase
VVGNISVGGTGKTPLVIWLAEELRWRGHRPGIITRGYGGGSPTWPQHVSAASDAASVGDEAVLLAARSKAIVVAGPDRVACANAAIERGATVILSDDGLQHYRLLRDYEIAVIDGTRGVGNGFLLPAGPLRESKRRLETVDAVVVTQRAHDEVSYSLARPKWFTARGEIRDAWSLKTREIRPLSAFAGIPVHAIAGIGHPTAFFDGLSHAGLKVDTRALADHAAIAVDDLRFADTAPVLMTEKDAVKCRAFADQRCWAVPLHLSVADGERLLESIVSVIGTPA